MPCTVRPAQRHRHPALDGNLLSDGRWTYTWDGENRLVKMASIAWTQPSGGYLANATFPAITLEFAYDGLSRRVQKKTIKNGAADHGGVSLRRLERPHDLKP